MPIDESELREVFKPGDIVRLNSGGPAMVVLETIPEDVGCVWFDRTGNVHENVFANFAIHHVKQGAAK